MSARTATPRLRAIRSLARNHGVFPTGRPGAPKAPAACVSTLFTELRDRVPTDSEILEWWGRADHGVGLHCGGPGHLYCLDFDDPDVFEPWLEMVREHDPDLADQISIVATPSGGRHVWTRAPQIEPIRNVKLACDQLGTVRIETRGRGGYALVPPSEGYEPITEFPPAHELTEEQVELLLGLARLFDEREVAQYEARTPRSTGHDLTDRPGDWYNRTADIDELVRRAGGHSPRTVGRRTYWCRPGKSKGVSLTTGNGSRGDLIVVHSSNWPPFETRCYDAFGLFAALEHGGDLSRAASAVQRMPGYPAPTRREPPPPANRIRLPEEESEPPRPCVVSNNRQLPEITADALAALAAANDPPTLFAQQGALVRIVADEYGRRSVQPIERDALTYHLARAADWEKQSARGSTAVAPPEVVVRDILASPLPPEAFPPLAGISAVPIATQTGIASAPGYDPRSGWYLTDSTAWPVWDGDAAAAAAWLLEHVFGDFPFVDEASAAHTLALMLSPYVRALIDEPMPMCLVGAPSPGTGKSLLVKAALMPALGRIPAAVPIPDNEQEFAKLLFALAIEGRETIVLDNLDRHLKSPSLTALLTAGEFGGRMLGVSSTRTPTCRAVFAITANNGTFSEDLARRMYHVRFEGLERPENRTGFAHPRLLQWCGQNRQRIVSACVAMVQEWLGAGRPPGTAQMGSYEGWSQVVGGILSYAGVPGFLANCEALRASSNDDGPMWAAYYQAWYERFGVEPTTTRDLLQLALDRDLLDPVLASAGTDRGRATAFGRAMTRQVDVVRSGLVARKSTARDGYSRFKIDVFSEQVNSHPSLRRRKIGINNACIGSRVGVHSSTEQVQNAENPVEKVHLDGPAEGEWHDLN